MTFGGRRTGHTFRQLMQSLENASEGKLVVYECTTLAQADWTMDKAIGICFAYFSAEDHENGFSFDRQKRQIKIANGSIKFISSASQNRLHEYPKNTAVVSDKHRWQP